MPAPTAILPSDLHYWVSLVGTATDRGTMSRARVAQMLFAETSASKAEAEGLIAILIAAGKIGERNGKLVTIRDSGK